MQPYVELFHCPVGIDNTNDHTALKQQILLRKFPIVAITNKLQTTNKLFCGIIVKLLTSVLYEMTNNNKIISCRSISTCSYMVNG